MKNAKTASADNSARPANDNKRTFGETAAAKIIDGWKGDFVSDAASAAFQFGMLVSANMLSLDRATYLVDQTFDMRKIDPMHRSTVKESFIGGRNTFVSRADFEKRIGPRSTELAPTQFEWADPSTIPKRDWIYGTHLLRRHVSATIASGAVGKTSLKIVEALALATGRPLLGKDVPNPQRVWLFNLEDDSDELRRRVTAAMIHYKITPEDIGDRLFIDGEKSLVITETTREGTEIRLPIVNALVHALLKRKIDVLYVDPFISSHDAPESDSGAMDLVMKAGWVPVARDADCAVELCHHTTKADASSGMATAMSGRGSGAVVFACRSVQVLNPMSFDQARAAALENPSGFFSAKDDKQNLTLKSNKLDWYKMVSVPLGNGKGNLANVLCDHIGVVTRWEWPSKTSFAEGVSDAELDEIKVRLRQGAHRKDGQATAWAGYAIASVLGLGSSRETLEDHDKQRIKKMIDAWVKAGHLKIYEERVNRDPNPKQFVTAADPA